MNQIQWTIFCPKTTLFKERICAMKSLLRLCAGLLMIFFLGFFLAGGRDVLRPETVHRVTDWAAENVRTAQDVHSGPARSDKADSNLTRLKRLFFLKEAVNNRIAEEKTPLTKDIPEDLLNAVVAVEDARFYSHPGFDIEGIVRAALVNIQTGEIEEGMVCKVQQP